MITGQDDDNDEDPLGDPLSPVPDPSRANGKIQNHSLTSQCLPEESLNVLFMPLSSSYFMLLYSSDNINRDHIKWPPGSHF